MKKKISLFKRLASWLDAIFMLPGMVFIVIGVFLIYIPAGFIVLGVCLIVLAFFIAAKYSRGGD